MKSAIYIRVSTTHQIDKDSLPLQRNDMINYSKFVLGIDDYVIFEDAGFSGKNTSRPAFQDMIKRVKEGEFSHLLVWKIDRISRNLIDFCEMYEDLKKYNCIFVSKNEQFDTSSAMGETMLKIVLVFAELERKLTGERVSATMIDRASKGLWNGAPVPLGYKWDKNIKFPVIDLVEKSTIEFIYENYKEHQSTSMIRNILNENNIKTKRGGTWTTKTISDIVRNPFYKGTYRYNYKTSGRGKKKDESEWIILDDNHARIIDKELWQECNDIMDINANRNNAKFRGNVKTHIFSSLLLCGECHTNMYAKQDKPHMDGFRPSMYVCKSRYNGSGCNQKTVSEKTIGEFVINFISNIMKVSMKDMKLTPKRLEKSLLSGKAFENVRAISNIDDIMNAISLTSATSFLIKKPKNKNAATSTVQSKLQQELNKYAKSLEKLEELYLFEDAAMSTKDYILKKNMINEKIELTKKKLTALPESNDNLNMDFIIDVITLELSKRLSKGKIQMKELILDIDRDILKEFMNAILDKVIVKDKLVHSIRFKNSLEVNFEY